MSTRHYESSQRFTAVSARPRDYRADEISKQLHSVLQKGRELDLSRAPLRNPLGRIERLNMGKSIFC